MRFHDPSLYIECKILYNLRERCVKTFVLFSQLTVPTNLDRPDRRFDLSPYEFAEASRVLTPALVLYPEIIRANVDSVLSLLDGKAERWRPHVKTSKSLAVMRILVDRGIGHFKCATTLELLAVCQAGATDVLVAYPAVGPMVTRITEIAAAFPGVRISVLSDSIGQLHAWRGTRIGVFVDLNSGMDRTGVPQEDSDGIVQLAKAVVAAGIELRGLHYYDGHYHFEEPQKRMVLAHRGYDRLLAIVAQLQRAGLPVREITTSGTPTFPCALAYAGFRDAGFIHRVSPGTIVFGDATSTVQLPSDYRCAPAALVLSRVVSHPRSNIITCDAGHKSVSVDIGVPNCDIVGHPDLKPLKPTEEHLPIEVPEGVEKPAIGEELYLIPRHVCPTVNNFDRALLVEGGRIVGTDTITARGHEGPLVIAPGTQPA